MHVRLSQGTKRPDYKIVYFRVRECKVSVGDFEIFPVHSFANTDACADDRLGVDLIQTSDHIDISYTAFRFRDGSSGK